MTTTAHMDGMNNRYIKPPFMDMRCKSELPAMTIAEASEYSDHPDKHSLCCTSYHQTN